MNFKTQRNRVSFGGRTAAVKQWVIGWTTDQASQLANRRAGCDQPVMPGVYGLLVGAGCRTGSGR